jgi:hypothetical protein
MLQVLQTAEGCNVNCAEVERMHVKLCELGQLLQPLPQGWQHLS